MTTSMKPTEQFINIIEQLDENDKASGKASIILIKKLLN